MYRSKRHKKKKLNKNHTINKSKEILARGFSNVTNVLKNTTDDLFNLVNEKIGDMKSNKSRKTRRKR